MPGRLWWSPVQVLAAPRVVELWRLLSSACVMYSEGLEDHVILVPGWKWVCEWVQQCAHDGGCGLLLRCLLLRCLLLRCRRR